ncbi:STAS domain-containing protein [Tunturiibacter lichenicola]|uniref:STAS domain-containing protein n=1 Tax=Tunturiibacter lichenicola TaxID=2051959 RepID=UPI0021B187E3|nr:STAS domain-containing protein [Edaphobacter lichenicola]
MPAATPPPFTLEIEDRGSSAVIRCHGKLVAGYTDLLYVPVSQLLPTHQRLILDLADLTHMDSMGLGALARIYVSAGTKGCELQLRHLGKKVRDLLIMTNLLPAFTIVGEHDIRM